MSKPFSWGRIIDRLEFDFDGLKMEVTKYHPKKFVNGQGMRGEFTDEVLFHCEEMSMSERNLFALIIAFIAYSKLGHNQHALVSGIARALELDKP